MLFYPLYTIVSHDNLFAHQRDSLWNTCHSIRYIQSHINEVAFRAHVGSAIYNRTALAGVRLPRSPIYLLIIEKAFRTSATYVDLLASSLDYT
jgi:hypothetical protein